MGRKVLDLGIGEARYKRLFCKGIEELADVFLPVTRKGWLYAGCREQLLKIKRKIKNDRFLWGIVQTIRPIRSRISP
jgi:CelD/BcsL family acetyltransferase involved in cellulose biosynthesis